jgi:hypothetical protein
MTPIAADGIGWPDLFMTRDGRAIAAELKSAKGRVTKAQQQWLDELDDVPGIEAYLWSPTSWDDIEMIPARKANVGT